MTNTHNQPQSHEQNHELFCALDARASHDDSQQSTNKHSKLFIINVFYLYLWALYNIDLALSPFLYRAILSIGFHSSLISGVPLAL